MKKLFPFNFVYCVSLSNSVARRKHIEEELNKHNINNYEFVDATGKNDHVVEEAYQNGMVKLFPSCFRCGRNVCECDNNVLIPTQVATFFSHMRGWEIIAKKTAGFFLIIEDDIKFNWYYRLLRPFVYIRINRYAKKCLGKPLLIRLAWAHNEEHKLQKIKFVADLVKMSNPMYAINPEMARALLDEFKIIDTTVDVYAHKQIAPKYTNLTLLPPLAHELSYSFGAVESLVRPRSKRIKELEKQTDGSTKEELDGYDLHVDKAVTRKLLAIGHPRTGSGYLSQLLNSYGLNIDHEKMGDDGIVSWMFSVYDLNNPFSLNMYAVSKYYVSFEHTIMFARDPLTAIPSIMRENRSSDVSFEFRAKHILKNFQVDIREINNEFEQAIETYYLWSKLAIEINKPSLFVRVEQDEDVLLEFLKKNNFDVSIECEKKPGKDVNANKLYKGKAVNKPQLQYDDWLQLDDVWKKKVNELCAILNYKPIFDDSLSVINR